jgi:DNA repair photolyase
VKINAPTLLEKALTRAKRGVVYISSITDAYQPVEKRYELTRKSLELLLRRQFPVNIQTKSNLVLRDLDIITKFDDIEIGVTVTTHDEKVRKLFEPGAPSIASRISTLKRLRKEGVQTYAFIAPILPLDPRRLVDSLAQAVDCILLDRLNYSGRIRRLYEKHGLARYLDEIYFEETAMKIEDLANRHDIRVEAVF